MPKITDLTADTAPDGSDVIPFVDVSAGATEKVTVDNLAASTAFSGRYAPLTDNPAVYLPGVAGNYISTPDHASFDVAGDLWVGAKVAPDDWTDATQPMIACRDDLGANRSWQFYLSNTGTLVMVWFASTVTRTAVSTVSTGFTDGVGGWVWALVDINNGAGQYDVKFYTGETPSQLGATVTGSTGVTTIDASAAPIRLGEVATYNPLAGQVQRFVMRDGGSGGTLVANYDASVSSDRYRDSTGKVWTITGSTWSRMKAA